MPCACPRPVTRVLTSTGTRTSTRHCPYSRHASHASSRFPPFAKLWGAPGAFGIVSGYSDSDSTLVAVIVKPQVMWYSLEEKSQQQHIS